VCGVVPISFSVQVPWIYTSLVSGQRLGVSARATPFVVGALMHGFIGTYEYQGPTMGWWKWPDATHPIIASGPQLEPFLGFDVVSVLGTVRSGLVRPRPDPVPRVAHCHRPRCIARRGASLTHTVLHFSLFPFFFGKQTASSCSRRTPTRCKRSAPSSTASQ
jgi:hypothetical protein